MSNHDELDDILSEIKKKKVAAGNNPIRDGGNFSPDTLESDTEESSNVLEFSRSREALYRETADRKPAAIPTADPVEIGWGRTSSPKQELSSPPDQRKTERISRQLAQQSLPASQGGRGGRAVQEQQWDALWQSVAVKKKKPELYDFDAEEKEDSPPVKPAPPVQEPPVYRQPPRQAEPQREGLWEDEEPAPREEAPIYIERRPSPPVVQERRSRNPAPMQRQEPPAYVEDEVLSRPVSPAADSGETVSRKTRQFHLSIPDLDESPQPPARTHYTPPSEEFEPEITEEEFMPGINDPLPQREERRKPAALSERAASVQDEPVDPVQTRAKTKSQPPESVLQPRRHSLFEDMNKGIFDNMEGEEISEEPSTAPTIDPEEEQQLHSRRKSKVNAFFAKKEFDIDQERGQEEEPERQLTRAGRLRENFGSESNEDDIRDRIEQSRMGTLIRLGISAVLFGLLFWLHLGKVYLLWLPGFMWPEYHPLAFIAVTFGMILTAALVNTNIVGGGLLSLFTLKPDNDSLTALSVVASVVQCAVLTIMPEYVMDGNVHLYCFIPALALTLSNIGRFMCINRMDRGSRIVYGTGDKYAILKVENADLARELTRGLDIEDPSVAVSVKAESLVNYDETSCENDFSENISRILAPICLAASLIVSIGGYFLSDPRSAFGALTSFAALTAVCSPLTASIAANMPLGRMSRQLHKEGSMLAGYQTADDFSDVAAVVLDATDLFSPKDVTLFTVKPFAEKRIDEALLDAASLICSTKSTLTGIFSNIIQGQKSLLHPVENILYEDGMGLSAWVNKKRVLIGNRALMQHYGVDTPSKDFEAKYCRDHRDILYLSNSGELSAMFVLGYSINENAAEMLQNLMEQNIAISVSVNDPNVTAEKICRLYEFPMEDIRIIPAQTQEALSLYCQPRKQARAAAAHMGTASAMVHAVCAAYSVRTAVVLATMIQFIGVFLGYAVLAFFAFTGAFANITPDLLAIYLAIWAILVVVIPRLRKI